MVFFLEHRGTAHRERLYTLHGESFLVPNIIRSIRMKLKFQSTQFVNTKSKKKIEPGMELRCTLFLELVCISHEALGTELFCNVSLVCRGNPLLIVSN